jgi:hypothetical protein
MNRLAVAVIAALALASPGSAVQSGRAAGDLDALLAPIALYPDQLLAQMLLCAANPGKVGALDEWLRSQETLKGTELQKAAAASGFEESFVVLALFPDVVSMMASQPDWTARLGQAFAADRSAVFGSIQRLRAKAKDAGKLKTTQQQEVETRTTSSGQQVIVIEPANPQVVYVPQYNPQTVYTSSTVVVQQESSSDADAAVAGLIGFTAGIAIGAAIDNDWYYGPHGWHGGAYMYNDAWDDWYDEREDAREDWMDHREDMVEERGERASDAREQGTSRQQTRQDTRTQSQTERTERQQTRQEGRPETPAGSQPQATSRSTQTAQTARGYSGERTSQSAGRERSGTTSDAFSGYSSGRSERAASSRGERSRSSSRGGGARRR